MPGCRWRQQSPLGYCCTRVCQAAQDWVGVRESPWPPASFRTCPPRAVLLMLLFRSEWLNPAAPLSAESEQSSRQKRHRFGRLCAVFPSQAQDTLWSLRRGPATPLAVWNIQSRVETLALVSVCSQSWRKFAINFPFVKTVPVGSLGLPRHQREGESHTCGNVQLRALMRSVGLASVLRMRMNWLAKDFQMC